MPGSRNTIVNKMYVFCFKEKLQIWQGCNRPQEKGEREIQKVIPLTERHSLRTGFLRLLFYFILSEINCFTVLCCFLI